MCATSGSQLPDALVGQARRRPRQRDRPQRLRVLVVDGRGDAARARRVLLVVERVAAVANDLERRPHRLRRNDRVRRDARQSLHLEDRVDLLVGQRGEYRLADARSVQRHPAAEPHQDPHHLVTLDLRDEHGLGAVEDGEVRGLARLLHQAAHVEVALRDEVAIGEKPGTDGEGVKADIPETERAGLIDVAHLFQRREEPVRRGRRQAHPMGEIRERDAAVGLGERFEQVEPARQALHLSGDGAGLRRNAALTRRVGEAMRHHA